MQYRTATHAHKHAYTHTHFQVYLETTTEAQMHATTTAPIYTNHQSRQSPPTFAWSVF